MIEKACLTKIACGMKRRYCKIIAENLNLPAAKRTGFSFSFPRTYFHLIQPNFFKSAKTVIIETGKLNFRF